MSSTPTSTPIITREQFLANLSPVPVDQCATIDEDTTCIICTNDPVDSLFDAEDEFAVVLHDRHVFGERCIREWLSENNTCPKCRAVLFEADEDDDSEYDTDDEMEDDDDEEEDTITAAEFEMILAEEDFEVAVSHGLLDSGARVTRFRRDFCRLIGLYAGEPGGQLDETELLELYFDSTAFPDFDPEILPLALFDGFADGTLPADFDPDLMPMMAINSIANRTILEE
jgi:hypothetical protein